MRTRHCGGTHHTRGRVEADRLLRRQADKAVRYAASTDRQIGEDPSFDPRAAVIAAHVRDIQTRADASAGRWIGRGGPADRTPHLAPAADNSRCSPTKAPRTAGGRLDWHEARRIIEEERGGRARRTRRPYTALRPRDERTTEIKDSP